MYRIPSKVRIPKYRHHKAKDLGVVTIDGRDYYLGKYGSPESKAEYDALIAQWMANGRRMPLAGAEALRPPPAASPATHAYHPAPAIAVGNPSLTIAQLSLAYLKYAKVRYPRNNAFSHIASVFKPLVKLFRHLPVVEFGPKRFKEVRDELVKRGLRRREINRRMQFLRNGIKWAVAEEMIPGEVLHRLMAVDILRRGEAAVPESEPVRPVEEAIVLETIKYVSKEVAAMVRLQMLTGARGGELFIMKSKNIDRSKDVWLYRPEHHKTKSRGNDRVIPMGPRAQQVLEPFLTEEPDVFLFSPARAEMRRRKELHEKRITPIGAGNSPGTNVRADPKTKPGDRYDANAFARAIARAARVAFPLPAHLQKQVVTPTGRKKKPRLETEREWMSRLSPKQRAEVKAWWDRHHWHPHQLRHTVGTAVRDRFGVDFSQALLGHANLSATQIYAEVNKAKAIEVMREIG